MSATSGSPAAQPVFKKCPRCGYSLRGLPAEHVCPECGLGFDEECELYRATNPRQILLVWIAIFGSGWVALRNLRHLTTLATASMWDKIGVFAALAWFPFVGSATWLLVRRYRRGFEVAVTSDGLLVHLPGFHDGVIPWESIVAASVKGRPDDRAQVASVVRNGEHRNLELGGVNNVFPTRADVERFVEQVNTRARAAYSEDTG